MLEPRHPAPLLRRQSSSTKRPRIRLSVDHFSVSASGRGTHLRSTLAASCSFENTRWKYLSYGWLIAVSARPPSPVLLRSRQPSDRRRTYPRTIPRVNVGRGSHPRLAPYSGHAIKFRMSWTVEAVAAVEAEIKALPVKLSARLIRLLETVENAGLEALRAPHVKHLDGKLWELRVRAEGGIARGIYVTAAERRVVVLHVARKSRKTPRRALVTARERMKQVVL